MDTDKEFNNLLQCPVSKKSVKFIVLVPHEMEDVLSLVATTPAFWEDMMASSTLVLFHTPSKSRYIWYIITLFMSM
jgi:hypothetical protein